MEGVGVMKDKNLNLEEIEVSHTLGGVFIHTQIRQSHDLLVYHESIHRELI